MQKITIKNSTLDANALFELLSTNIDEDGEYSYIELKNCTINKCNEFRKLEGFDVLTDEPRLFGRQINTSVIIDNTFNG